jgi:hypothetical protein
MSLICLAWSRQRELLARLREVVEAKDAEAVLPRAELAAARERGRRLELRVTELERRLGRTARPRTPPSKDPIGARERCQAERRARQSSERERREDRKRGGSRGYRRRGAIAGPGPGPAGGSATAGHLASR